MNNVTQKALQTMNDAPLDEKLAEIALTLSKEDNVDAVLLLLSVRNGLNEARLAHAEIGSPHAQIGMLADMHDLVCYTRDIESEEPEPPLGC